jgi:hypothetical protein
MPAEIFAGEALIKSAGGNFYLVLLAVVLVGAGWLARSMISSYIWALKTIAEENRKSNEKTHALIADGMLEIVTAIKEYKCDTEKKFGDHDEQARRIGLTVERIDVKLDHAIKNHER